MRRRVVFYRGPSGNRWVEESLDSLTSPAARKVTRVLRPREEERFGPARFLWKLAATEGIWECRVDHGSHTYRILCFMASGDTLVLTHGFARKSPKVPASEIRRARTSRAD